MKPENLSALSNNELLQKAKKMKSDKIINAAIIGLTIGIVIYSIVKNGIGFFAFFPLVLAYFIARNSKNNQILENEIESELKSRNLNFKTND